MAEHLLLVSDMQTEGFLLIKWDYIDIGGSGTN